MPFNIIYLTFSNQKTEKLTETHCIIKIEAEANKAYENWTTEMTSAAHV